MFALLVTIFLASAFFLPTEQAFAYRKVRCLRLYPPEKILEGVKRIAILDFEGERGRTVSDQLVSLLLEEDRGIYTIPERSFQEWATTKVFDIVERSRLQQIMAEQELGQTGVIDDAQAADLGKVLGVDALISGRVITGFEDSQTREKRTIWRKEEEGGSYDIMVNCLTRKVNVTVKIRIISAVTAQIMGVKDAARTAEQKECAEEIDDIASASTMIDQSIRSATREIANYFSPYFGLTELELRKIKNKEHKKRANEASILAAQGDLDDAYIIYYTIFEKDNYNARILYNIGILNEAVSNFSQAKEMYDNALSLQSKDKTYRNAAARVEFALTRVLDFESYGIEAVEYKWDTSESAMAVATEQRITVRGKSSVRKEVYTEPDNASAVIAKVPGGIELVVLAEEDDWFKVKLMGEKEGYIHKSFVK